LSNYIVYYNKNRPFLALPLNYDIKNLYPTFWKRVKLLRYKKKIEPISDVLDFEFIEYCKEAIVFFNNTKTVIQDIEQKRIIILGKEELFNNDFYNNYNDKLFKTFRLPKLIYSGGYFAVFEYVKGECIKLDYKTLKEISDEIYIKCSFHHGDLHSSNVITKDGINYIIDWDDRKKYSNNYDFCHYYLVESFRNFERKGFTKKNFDFFINQKEELLKYISLSDYNEALSSISKARKFKKFDRIKNL